MQYIAHRGLWEDIKDSNKLSSLKKALDNPSFIGIETDVRVTKDQKYILYHDSLFKGQLIKNINYSEMQEENVALLKDLLEIKTNKIILLEIKDFNMDIDKFLKFLNSFNQNIYLMSFSTGVIEKIKNKTDKYKLGVLNYVLNTPKEYTLDFICLLNDVLTDYIVNSFKTKKITIIGYGVRKNATLNYNISYIIDPKYLQ